MINALQIKTPCSDSRLSKIEKRVFKMMKRKKNWGGKLQFIGCRIEDILKILALLIRPIRIHSVTDLGSG